MEISHRALVQSDSELFEVLVNRNLLLFKEEICKVLHLHQVGIILEPTNLIPAQMKGHEVTMDIKQTWS